MSLINDALKKAHKDSSGNLVGPSTGKRKHSRHDNRSGENSSYLKWMAIITLIVAVSCSGIILAVIYVDGTSISAKSSSPVKNESVPL